jgi:hypothetical protein
LYKGPDYHQNAQSLFGEVGGDLGGTYGVKLYLHWQKRDGSTGLVEIDFSTSAGIFTRDAASTGNQYFGCTEEGSWEAWFILTGLSGRWTESNHVYWSVGFPAVHGVP